MQPTSAFVFLFAVRVPVNCIEKKREDERYRDSDEKIENIAVISLTKSQVEWCMVCVPIQKDSFHE